METTAQLLSAFGLAIGTIDYAILIRRRAQERLSARARQLEGLRGLVRVLGND